MALELQLIKHHSGLLIPATPETSDILQSKTRLGDILVAEFRRVRNPAFHRRFFALLNLGFEYWEPTGGAISSNERKLITGYAKFLVSYGGNEGALIDAAEQYLELVAYRRVTNGISLCKSFDAYRSWVIVEAGHFDAIQLDANRRRREDEKRTKMVNDYLKGVGDKPLHERPAAASVVVEALQKEGE